MVLVLAACGLKTLGAWAKIACRRSGSPWQEVLSSWLTPSFHILFIDKINTQRYIKQIENNIPCSILSRTIKMAWKFSKLKWNQVSNITLNMRWLIAKQAEKKHVGYNHLISKKHKQKTIAIGTFKKLINPLLPHHVLVKIQVYTCFVLTPRTLFFYFQKTSSFFTAKVNLLKYSLWANLLC